MRKSLRLLLAGVIFIALIAGMYAVYHYLYDHEMSSRADNTVGAAIEEQRTDTASLHALMAALEADIAAQPEISTAVSVTDLSSGEQINAGLSDTVFRAASTTKVLTAAAYLHEVEQDSASLTQYIAGDTAQNLLRYMIEVSDNNAWHALNGYLGYARLQTYGEEIGLTHWNARANTLTAADAATLLAKLYAGDLLNAAHTALLLEHMANTTSTDLISAALPDDATIYHKYGRLEGELHDAAIIKYRGHTFILVIFTHNQQESIGNYDARAAYLHRLTRTVLTAYES